MAAAVCLLAAPRAGALAVGYNEDAARLVAVPQAVKRSNTQVLRVGSLWQALEPQRDVYDWAPLDRAVALMREARIRPMITVFGSAKWADGGTPGINCPCDRAADPEWRDLWRNLALRYPDAVLNVWNEPNIPAFGNVSAARMAELVNQAAAAIWEVDPERPVVGPPTAPWGDWTRYSASLYPRLDPRVALAANLYPRGRILENLRSQLAAADRIAGQRPVWITETNVSREEVGARRQARYVREAYRLARRRGFSGLIFQRLWSPFRAADGIGAWDAGLSALRPDAGPRRLYDQIGRLHPGFRGLVAPPSGSGLVVGEVPPPPILGGLTIPPCPES